MFTVVVWPSATGADFSVVRNPSCLTETLYCPGCNKGKPNAPEALVFVVAETPVSAFVSETVALPITAFDGSVTVPAIAPVVAFCAKSTPGTNRAITAKTAHSLLRDVKRISCLLQIFTAWNRMQAPWPL